MVGLVVGIAVVPMVVVWFTGTGDSQIKYMGAEQFASLQYRSAWTAW